MEYQLSEHLQEEFSALQLNDDLLFLRISPKNIYNFILKLLYGRVLNLTSNALDKCGYFLWTP